MIIENMTLMNTACYTLTHYPSSFMTISGCDLKHSEKGGVMIFDEKFAAFGNITITSQRIQIQMM